jgi:PAS domain S-box-containing protein
MPRTRRAGLLVLLTAAYFVAGRLGLSLAYVNESASAVWPATGIALAAALLLGRGVWPAILAGAFLVNLSNLYAPVPSFGIALGNTAEMLLVSWLLDRAPGGHVADVFGRTTRILLYVMASAAGAAVAATVGTLVLLAAGLAGAAPPSMVWLTWWAGDLSGALLVAPSIVTWAVSPRASLKPRRLIEAAVVVAAVGGAAYFVFGPTPAGVRQFPLMFVILPTLLWAALRFGPRGATFAMLVASAMATSGTLEGYGPFARGEPNVSLLLLQAYLGVKMVIMLSLAAEAARRQTVEREMRVLNAELAARVQARTEELQRLHGRLLEAQDVAHIGSWEWEVAADSIWWSDEMYRVYGLTPGSPVDFERFISLVHPDDRANVQAIVGRSGETGEPFTFEHRAVTADGAVRTIHSRGRVVKGPDGRAVRMLGVGHDVTELKRAEEERIELAREQAARREAEEASRMKDYFLATLSHELRTPLNAVLGWTQMLRDRSLDERARGKALEAIHRNVIVQAQLVSDILDVSRMRSGTLGIDAQPVALRTVVAGALDVLRPMIEAKHISIAVRVAEEVWVSADAKRLQQVFWNVLSNAVKFTPDGGRVSLESSTAAERVRVTVRDTGPGIPVEFLPHVFEQFRQADQSLTREHGGLGLGLAISRSLIALHGGTITAANHPEGGALFTIELPAAVAKVSSR